MSLRRPFAAFLSACLLAAQLVLPLAHELQVAREEARHPFEQGWTKDAGGRISQGSKSHSHHDPAACQACPAVSRLGAALSYGEASIQALSSGRRLPQGRPLFSFGPCRLHSSSRGPPAA